MQLVRARRHHSPLPGTAESLDLTHPRWRSAVAYVHPAACTRCPEAVSRERGDTYIELLMAMVIIAFAAVAILGALTTSLAESAQHRSLAVDETLVKSYLETAKNVIELQSSPKFAPCAPNTTYDPMVMSAFGSSNVPQGYSIKITQVQYWNGSGFGPMSGCQPTNFPNAGIQQITATASNSQSAMSLTTIVRDPCYETSSSRTC